MNLWSVIYLVAVPFGVVLGAFVLVRNIREVFVDPTLDGPALYQERSVRARAKGFWPARHHVWVTERELVMHLRADYGSWTGTRDRRYLASRIRKVFRTDKGVRVELALGAIPSAWTLEAENPSALERALQRMLA